MTNPKAMAQIEMFKTGLATLRVADRFLSIRRAMKNSKDN